jgi:hypothetical protein
MSSKPMVQQLQDDLNAVIKDFKYGEITFCEAIGVLEIIKMDLWISQNDATAEVAGAVTKPIAEVANEVTKTASEVVNDIKNGM